MPHMSPISWTLILSFSIFSVLIMASMIYFKINPSSPYLKKMSKEILKQKWEW
uniref:ATP synthase complex subunit 8 n=1 Tax=Glyptelasma annandalei TaxID=2590147 RepID=A0A4Y5UZ96_9CRUS|nr:ATP synthase F0 subunit 8 [Glyptelasma annandalei]QDD68305.1 ATP synthase F0 subunit 8 [Glyptelasma annandalei]